MRDKLIQLTCIILFGLLLMVIAPRINALAAEMGRHDVIECEAGAQIIQLEEGRIRVLGECVGVRSRANEDEKVYEYPYPVPEVVYPGPVDTDCDILWSYGQSCPWEP